MGQLTNNRDEFINQLKSELLEYEIVENWREIFTYAEIPYFLQYVFSYNWSINPEKNIYRLKRKEWNAAYDHARFDKGIYNLDSLAVVEKEIQINAEDSNCFNAIDWKIVATVEFKGIALDGVDCNLRIRELQKILNWNVDVEMNTALAKLVDKIRNWKREFEG